MSTDRGTGQGFVAAIVTITKPETTIGDKLYGVRSLLLASYSAKKILNVSDEDDALKELDELPRQDRTGPCPPTPFMAGMLTDDPVFESVMGSKNPGAVRTATGVNRSKVLLLGVMKCA